jgi:hypothetical protein
LAAILFAPAGAAAQNSAPSDLVRAGIRAYEDVQLGAAATWLRRALAESLSRSDQIRALTYLGAVEVARGPSRSDSAAAAFRQLLLLDPRQRPDPVVFPPAVLRVFTAVRRATKAVIVVPRPAGDQEGFVTDVYGTSPHELEVRLASEDGLPVRTLYNGPVGDSMDLRWDGRDGEGARVPTGRYTLAFLSRLTIGGAVVREVVLPLEAEVVVPALLPLPPPPQLLPERTSGRSGRRSLAIGLVGSGLAVALPSLIAGGSKPSTGRFVVAGAVSVVGAVGFLTGHARPLAANVATNQATRAAWQQRVDAVTAENEQQRRRVHINIRAGTWTIPGGTRP